MKEMVKTAGRPFAGNRRFSLKPVSWRKIVEVGVWGALIWGLGRMACAYFDFTPYGLRVFSRPFVGYWGEDTDTGRLLGPLVMGALSVGAAGLYAYLFSHIRWRWLGLAYGAALFLLFALFFAWWTWDAATVSTEFTWFLTYGLFVGMSMTAERHDEE